MKTFLKHHWFSLPLLLAALLCLSLLLMLGYPTFLDFIVGILEFLVILALPVSWFFLIRKKEWLKLSGNRNLQYMKATLMIIMLPVLRCGSEMRKLAPNANSLRRFTVLTGG